MNRLSRGSISLGGSRRQSSQTLSYEKVEGLTTKPAMPAWQLEDTLRKELGDGWREHVASFEEAPVAAASIGQVRRAPPSPTRLQVKKLHVKLHCTLSYTAR